MVKKNALFFHKATTHVQIINIRGFFVFLRHKTLVMACVAMQTRQNTHTHPTQIQNKNKKEKFTVLFFCFLLQGCYFFLFKHLLTQSNKKKTKKTAVSKKKTKKIGFL